MTTIYIVTTGNYSDYRIRAAYSTREQAQRLIDVLEDGTIEKYILDEFQYFPEDMHRYEVTAFLDGRIQVFQTFHDDFEEHHFRGPGPVVRVIEPQKTYPAYLGIYLWARDDDHARKIAGEVLAKYQAEKDQGVT